MEKSLWCTDQIIYSSKAAMTALLVCLSSSVFCQTTFSKRFTFGEHTSATAVVVSGDQYGVTGMSTSFDGGFHYRMLASFWNQTGELIIANVFGNIEDDLLPFGWNTFVNSNGNIMVPVSRKQPSFFFASLIEFDSNADTLISINYQSPYFIDQPQSNEFITNEVIYINFIDTDSFGSRYISCSIFDFETYTYDFCVIKTNPEGDILWTYIHNTPADPDACYSLVAQDDGVVLGVLEIGQTNESSLRQLIKLDSAGNEMWTQPLNSIVPGLFYDMIPFGNDFIVASSQLAGPNQVIPLLYKLDTLGQILWTYTPDVIPLDYHSMNGQRLIQTSDGNLAMASFNIIMDEVWGLTEQGRLTKVDSNGNLIWERLYVFDEATCRHNNIYDLKATPDGGVIFCGESYDCPTGEGPYQQGWLVKLDACGCLVPGCDPNCIIDNLAEQSHAKEALMVAGPNPAAGSEFYVHVRTQAAGSLRIHDLQGREVKNIRLRGEGTYAVGCSKWATGVYVVSLEADGRVLETLKVVRE